MTSMGISPAVLERLAGSLLHFVWQGAAIAIIAAVTLRLLRHRQPEWRYGVALAALAAMFAAPFLTFAFYAETGALTLRLLRGLNGAAVAASHAAADDINVWTQRIVVVWIIGVAVFLTRLFGGWLLSRRLVRSATAVVAPIVKDAFERARTGLSFRGKVRLLSGERVETPMVIGWLRPAILLPASALTGLDPDQLLAILAHELAHVRRHDFLVNGIQRAVECVLFYHPAVWWISGRIRVERERCCDDLAVGVSGNKLIYAQALVAIENARSTAAVLAVPSTGAGLKDRVRRILGVQGANRDWQSAAAALVFAAILVGAGMWQPPTMAGPTIPPVALAPPSAVPPPPVAPIEPPAATAPLRAILAIATAEGVRPTATEAPPEPALQVTQPPISASREAARDKLGLLRVDYSVDSFLKQAAEGDTIAVKTFLLAGMNINARDGAGFTALIKAAQAGQAETAQSLLAAGANPNLTVNGTEASALSFAAERGDLPTMKVLLSGGADVDLKTSGGNIFEGSALSRAAVQGQRDAVILLLDNKASINGKSPDRSPLVSAACNRKFEIARLLVDRGADVNAKAGTATALTCAASRLNVEFMQLLLDKGAEINVTSDVGSVVHLAINAEAQDVGKVTEGALLLINRGAPVNQPSRYDGEAPLIGAVRRRLPEVVRALLDKGADPNKTASNRNSPLAEALTVGRPVNTDIAQALIDHGADVNAPGSVNPQGQTPLLLAIQAKEVGVVRALLAKGADPNLANRNLTPLRAAADLPEIKKLLIDAGAKQ